MRTVSDLTPNEESLLTEILSLIRQLPQPLVSYTHAMGQMRRTVLMVPSHIRHRRPAGFIDGHKPRAS